MDLADIYVRLFLDYEHATSLERQEADCRRWCSEHGLVVRLVHLDRGISGYKEHVQRGGFNEALAAVAGREVSTVVVWKLDRLSRRGIGQVGQLLESFERAGGRLVSVADHIDTAQPHARMTVALLSEFARAESETIGVRVRAAKESQRARGMAQRQATLWLRACAGPAACAGRACGLDCPRGLRPGASWGLLH